jgi:peptidoglycan hydrolase-like protein with peptidoglycan-binding domain
VRFTTMVVAITLSVLAVLTTPAAAQTTKQPDVSVRASWHGRAIEAPRPAPRAVRAGWPTGWSAGVVERGTGYVRDGGSRRVRDVQRRLTKLGYRPGPIDGRFGPRTEAAARWFQYKHGLPTTGRVNRVTLEVLRARSDHRPIRTTAPNETGAETETTAALPPQTAAPQPAPAPVTANDDGGSSIVPYLVAIAAALAAGLLVGSMLPRRRRRVPVLGYVRNGSAELVAADLDEVCAEHQWAMVRIIRESDDAGTRLVERPGLLNAIEQIEQGQAAGLVAPRVRELTTRLDDLAMILQYLTAADGFLATADQDIDTSTPDGKAAAATVIDIAGWRKQPAARFEPVVEPHIAALEHRGIPTETIADALNLAGVPAPGIRGHWEPSDVAAASRRAQEAHG